MRSFSFLFITSFCLLLFSCGEKMKETDALTSENLEQKDTLIYPEIIAENFASYPFLGFDFQIDSTFLSDSLKNHNLFEIPLKTVKEFTKYLSADEQTADVHHYLNSYFAIEKSKKDGTYETFKQELDIGMIQNAQTYSIGRLEYGDTLGIIIWKIHFKSYEACPFFVGEHFMGTLVNNSGFIETIRIATSETGADAPMSFSLTKLAKFNADLSIDLKSYSVTFDENEEIENNMEEFKYQITQKGFKRIEN